MKQSTVGTRGLQALRIRNQELILRQLASGVSLSQKELAAETGLSEATVSNLVAVLVSQGDVEVTPGMRNGRRANLLSKTAKRGEIMVGVNVSRKRIVVAGILSDGSIEHGRTVVRSGSRDYGDELPRIIALVDELANAGEAPLRIVSVGVGVGITVDSLIGKIAQGDTLPREVVPGFNDTWVLADIAADLTAHYGVPSIILNDCDAAALAEQRRGAASGTADVLYVHLGYGVGGGLVLGGRLYRGGQGGFAAEIGHMSGDPNGRLCICGNRGCLEMLFGDALLAAVADVHGADITLEDFAHLAQAGDPACLRVLAEVTEPLAAGLANPIAVVTPARVVIGGPIAEAGDALLRPLTDRMRNGGVRQFWRGEVVLSTMGDDNVAIGAAIAAGELATVGV